MRLHRPANRLVFSLALTGLLAACGGGGSDAPALESAQQASQRPVELPACPAAPRALQSIGSVQGSGERSPLEGELVTVRGVVTADLRGPGQFSGFSIQSPVPDLDPSSSEGLFVFATGNPATVGNTAALAVGDYVQVSGRITEFQRAGDRSPLTQIANLESVERCGAAEPIRPTTVALPVDDLARFEQLENMLVQYRQPLVVSGNFTLGRFGELVLAPERLFQPNNHPSLAADEARELNARSQIVLDDASNLQNPPPIPFLSSAQTDGTRRVGDRVRDLQGILTWAFDAWRVQPTVAPAFEPTNPRPEAPPAVGGALKVASLNVLNYFTTLGSRGATNDVELARQQVKLVETIVRLDADVLGLIEIENNGPVAMARLVAAVNAASPGPDYAFRDAGLPGSDQIKVAVIHRPERVHAIGNPSVPSDPDFVVAGGLRPPVAQRFAAAGNGGGFWFVVVHHKSKGSCPASADDADADRGQGCWNAARTRQSQALLRWVDGLVAASGEADVLMAGDFNAYLAEDPLAVLAAGGHENLHGRLPAEGRYTYQFDSESGALDHAFVSVSLQAQVAGFGVWHTNADEPIVLDYNLEFKTDDRWAPTAFRASDHDPVLVGLTLQPDPPAVAPVLGATLPVAGQAGSAVVVTDIAAQPVAGLAAALEIDWGDGHGWQQLTLVATSASNVYEAEGRYAVRLRLQQPGLLPAELVTSVSVAPRPAPAVGLYFSEYVEGSSNNKALEIHNPGPGAVDLSRYRVRLYNNGAATPNTTLTLGGTLDEGAVRVIYNPSFNLALFTPPAGSVASGITAFNGDDALRLVRIDEASGDGIVIDQIGLVGCDPGSAWVSGSVTTLDRTLRRKAGIAAGNVPLRLDPEPSLCYWDVAAQWDVLPIDGFDGLGTR